MHKCRANVACLSQWHFSLNLIFIFCSSNIPCSKWKDVHLMIFQSVTIPLFHHQLNSKRNEKTPSLHVTHKNLFKRFVAGRSILNITIYDFFHCVVLVRVAGLRIRWVFFSFQILSTVLPFTRQIWPRWRRSWVILTWRVSPQPSDGVGASGSQQSVSWQDDGCWENNMSN